MYVNVFCFQYFENVIQFTFGNTLGKKKQSKYLKQFFEIINNTIFWTKDTVRNATVFRFILIWFLFSYFKYLSRCRLVKTRKNRDFLSSSDFSCYGTSKNLVSVKSSTASSVVATRPPRLFTRNFFKLISWVFN